MVNFRDRSNVHAHELIFWGWKFKGHLLLSVHDGLT